MYFGRLEPEFAFAMMATVIVALACTGWVWLAGRELAGEDGNRWRRAILHNTPALAVAGADVVMLLMCITLPRTPLLVQYTTSHNQGQWQAWGWWFMIGGLRSPEIGRPTRSTDSTPSRSRTRSPTNDHRQGARTSRQTAPTSNQEPRTKN